MDEKVMVDGVKRVVSKLLARRKLKRSYEYEVQWEGQPSSSDYTAWLSRDRSVLSRPFNTQQQCACRGHCLWVAPVFPHSIVLVYCCSAKVQNRANCSRIAGNN